jgi:hypothetical protein
VPAVFDPQVPDDLDLLPARPDLSFPGAPAPDFTPSIPIPTPLPSDAAGPRSDPSDPSDP